MDGLAQDGVSVAVQRRYTTLVAGQHQTVQRMPNRDTPRRNGINDIARSEHQPAQARAGLPRHAQTTFGGMAAASRKNAMKHGPGKSCGNLCPYGHVRSPRAIVTGWPSRPVSLGAAR
jgi:hypothetical protein